MDIIAVHKKRRVVRTNRIPSGELKLEIFLAEVRAEDGVRTNRIPSGELKQLLQGRQISRFLGPNKQNSERGIETG